MDILFLELAEQEFYDTKDYYEEQQKELGLKFQEEIIKTLNRKQKIPNMIVKVKKDDRKCVVNKFPYNILYSVEKEHILVLTVAHHHRRPDYWIDRIK